MTRSLLIPICLLFLAGCGDSDQQPKEKAERLSLQAGKAAEQQNYEEAERLLAECVDLYAEENNDAKLAENYATLSSVQTSAGKIGPALETLSALRELYRSAADRNAELHTMFEMAKLNFRLGNTGESVRLLHEAFVNSSLFRLDELHAVAGIEAGTLQHHLGRYEQGLPYLTAARKYFTATRDLPRIIEVNTLLIAANTATGRMDAAYTLFEEADAIIAANPRSFDRPRFHRSVGDAFFRTDDPAFARANYLRTISILNQNHSANDSPESIISLLKLGELYFTNFSFPEAQQFFVAAYNLAKNRSDEYLQAYLLTRISDCLSKVSIYKHTRDGLIRSAQLYEQAQTLFARRGFGLGEAVAMHRLGTLKEFSGDESAAITFYKRAFEKYLNHTTAPVHYMLPVPAERLFSEPSQQYAPNEWFSERLIGLLLKFKRYQEALTYVEMNRSIALLSRLEGIPVSFRDPEKRSRYSAFSAGVKEKNRLQLELFHLTSSNRNYASKLQQRLKYVRSKVESDAITLMRDYPVFSFIGFSHQSVRPLIDEKIPAGTIILDYCIVNNDVWSFVIRPGEPVTAVQLSAYGPTVRSMMDRYMEGLSFATVSRSSMTELSADLFAILVKRLESAAPQKMVIIPPAGYSSFPFHSLGDGGRTPADGRSVVYLPHLSMINSTAQTPRFINNVVAFGYTPDFRWGLEYELRDTRSFFRNTQVMVNQTATVQRLENALGEILQVSSPFTKDADEREVFMLSDGTASKSGAAVPVEKFATLHPFEIVYLSDVQTLTKGMSDLAPILWILNGSAGVIMNRFPISPAVSKAFGEQFYSSLSLDLNPSLAYRKGIQQLSRRKDLREGFGGASYFYFGIR